MVQQKRSDIERVERVLRTVQLEVDSMYRRCFYAYYFEYSCLLEQLCDRMDEKKNHPAGEAEEELTALAEIGRSDELVTSIVKVLRSSKYSSVELQGRELLMQQFADVKGVLEKSIFTGRTEFGAYLRSAFALWVYEGTRYWFGEGFAGLPLQDALLDRGRLRR